jgi:TIGR03009 family protein
MRRFVVFTLFAGLASAAFLSAQQQPNLDQVLDQWEKAMSGMKSFSAEVKRIELDKTFGNAKDVWSGWAKFLKGPQKTASRGSMYLKKETAQPTNDPPFEYVLCTGNFLYQFSQATKEIIVHEMPQNPDGQLTDDNILAFLFGRRAAAAKQRYEMTLTPKSAIPPAQAEWYHFVQIKPRHEADKSDFSEARLVLWAKDKSDKEKTAFLPVEFWFRQPTGKEVTWAFPKVVPNVEIPATDFSAPTSPPQGWTLKKAPPQQTKVRN